MKTLHLNGGGLSPLRGGTGVWYEALGVPHGDLYEAEELWRDGHPVSSNRLLLVRFPDGAVLEPVPQVENGYFGEALWTEGSIAVLRADFAQGVIRLFRFHPDTEQTEEVTQVARQEMEDCYNVMLHGDPLMLTRQSEGIFEILWPEKIRFPVGETEVFCFREGDRLYFSAWYEDPDYREEMVVRALETGEVLTRFPGDIQIMPDGQKWLLT